MTRIAFLFIFVFFGVHCQDDATTFEQRRDVERTDMSFRDGFHFNDKDGSFNSDRSEFDVSEDFAPDVFDDDFHNVSLKGEITGVQPMTGIVLWEEEWNDSAFKAAQTTQIEYTYFPPSHIVKGKGQYDWKEFDAFLDRVSARKHQAMPRFYYTYVGKPTVVPQYIKELNSYHETKGRSEGKSTWFPDWSNQELQDATLAFYTAFAKRYDKDPRIAFIQVGFGLWGEYHIYEGPHELGKQFPSYAFQKRFVAHLEEHLKTLRWSISIDAADADGLSAFPNNDSLLDAHFGVFDDSFMHKDHKKENEPNWNFFDYTERFKTTPHGGEFSYYSDYDQKHVLDDDGPHGESYESFSKRFFITYMIGNDQPSYKSADRIKRAGMANGYKFEITKYQQSSTHTRLEIRNKGTAPMYYDAYPSLADAPSQQSLKGLLPGEMKTFLIPSVVGSFEIHSHRLVEGQKIEYDADL